MTLVSNVSRSSICEDEGKCSASECGDAVTTKAQEMGLDTSVGKVLVMMIEQFRQGGRPGYTLANADDVDISEDTVAVKALVEAVYANPIRVKKLIEPNRHVSVMMSPSTDLVEEFKCMRRHTWFVKDG